MPRDYAKKPAPPKREPIPGWVWLVSGLIIGLFIAFLGYLSMQKPGRPQPASPAKLWEEQRKADRQSLGEREKPAPKREESKSSYDFYTILPKYEVSIPKEDIETPPEKPQPEKPVPGKTPVAPGERVILQVGSFKSSKDADTRKAELALLGIVASIEKVTINGGDTWHRVRVGPLGPGSGLDALKLQLQENGIDYIQLKDKS